MAVLVLSVMLALAATQEINVCAADFTAFCTDCNETACTQCQTGFVLGPESRSCVACNIGNCNNCVTDGVCSECATSYTLAPGGVSCVLCTVPNCISCTTENNCGTCQFPYVAENNECFLCNISNCERCSADNECLICATGYTKPESDKSTCY